MERMEALQLFGFAHVVASSMVTKMQLRSPLLGFAPNGFKMDVLGIVRSIGQRVGHLPHRRRPFLTITSNET